MIKGTVSFVYMESSKKDGLKLGLYLEYGTGVVFTNTIVNGYHYVHEIYRQMDRDPRVIALPS